MALEQIYIQCVRYADKEPKKSHRPSSTHIHPNFELQDYLSPRNAFLHTSINISTGFFGTDKFLIRYGLCHKENIASSVSHPSVGYVLAQTEEPKGNIQKNSFVKTLLLYNKQTALIRRLPSR